MVFNPLKNRNVEAPIDVPNQNASNQSQDYDDYDDLVQHDSAPNAIKQEPTIHEVKQNLTYEGQNISDLEDSGLQTITLLKVASQNVSDKTKFNIPLLNATPVNFVLQSLGAKKIKDNLYSINEQEIATKENKWYNKTQKRGHIDAISLVKHLTAIEEKIDEQDNQKTLFISACKKLTKIQENANNQEMIVEQESAPATPTKIEEKVNEASSQPQPINYQVSDAVKQAQEKAKQNANNNIDWKALTEQLNNIPLNLVMEHIGANPNEDGQRGKWKIWKTGHNMQITGQQWHSWNAQRGGFGGISLLAFQLGIENNIDDRNEENKKALRRMAINELIKVFGSDYNLSNFSAASVEVNFKEPFSMPHVIDFKITQVKEYLNEKRGLPMWIINKQIKAGSLFAGFPSDWKEDPHLKNPEKLTNDKVWATFLAVNGNAAEMRAIKRDDQYAKILAKGSDKEFGGFLIKAEKDCTEKTVVSCEAAIDTMSYHAFYPGRIVSSCMGVNFNLAVKAAIEALDHGYKYQLAFDNDLAGNEAAVRFRESLINEIGEEEYNDHMKEGNIKYFDLGIKCLRKTIEKGGVFYFDVKNNDMGREAATMFQEQLFKVIPRETVKELIQKGKIKYANIAPEYGMMQDPEKEAERTLQLLTSNKPFYLVLKQGDQDEKDEIRVKRESFEKAFQRLAGEQLSQFEKEGKVIYKKQAIAKDWNEFFVVCKRDPRFKERLNQLEEKYLHYSEEPEPAKKNNKKP